MNSYLLQIVAFFVKQSEWVKGGTERAHASLLTIKAFLINLLYEAQAATKKSFSSC